MGGFVEGGAPGSGGRNGIGAVKLGDPVLDFVAVDLQTGKYKRHFQYIHQGFDGAAGGLAAASAAAGVPTPVFYERSVQVGVSYGKSAT